MKLSKRLLRLRLLFLLLSLFFIISCSATQPKNVNGASKQTTPSQHGGLFGFEIALFSETNDTLSACYLYFDNGKSVALSAIRMTESVETKYHIKKFPDNVHLHYIAISVPGDISPIQPGENVTLNANCVGASGTHYHSSTINMTMPKGSAMNMDTVAKHEIESYNITVNKTIQQNENHQDGKACSVTYNQQKKDAMWLWGNCYGTQADKFFLAYYVNSSEITRSAFCTLRIEDSSKNVSYFYPSLKNINKGDTMYNILDIYDISHNEHSPRIGNATITAYCESPNGVAGGIIGRQTIKTYIKPGSGVGIVFDNKTSNK